MIGGQQEKRPAFGEGPLEELLLQNVQEHLHFGLHLAGTGAVIVADRVDPVVVEEKIVFSTRRVQGRTQIDDRLRQGFKTPGRGRTFKHQVGIGRRRILAVLENGRGDALGL